MAEVISVSALNTYVRSLLEGDAALGDIAVEGEVANFNRNYKSGHCYFSLGDGRASIKAVMFKGDAQRLSFLPENGMKVIVRGRVSLYERDGAYQLYAEFLFPQGQGAAQMAFEQLQNRLEAEGLFAPEHKQLLPAHPKNIGLITSKTGAALQDILNIAGRRCPIARFTLAPVTVQGAAAAPEVVAALRQLGGMPGIDLIIITRGGGSAEDLGVFNDEGIARAVYACPVPVVSAIGHEIDYTILDFVADLRAPTPSAAAEIALPDMGEWMQRALHLNANITNNMQFLMDSWYNQLRALARAPALAARTGALAQKRRRLNELRRLAAQNGPAAYKRAQGRLAAAARLAEGLSPYAVLARGYAVAMQNGVPLQSAATAQKGGQVNVVLHDGALDCRIENITKGKVPLDGK